jgi:hypothetical protein
MVVVCGRPDAKSKLGALRKTILDGIDNRWNHVSFNAGVGDLKYLA